MAPRGHYLAHEVGFLAGISGQLVGQWAKNGYIRSSWKTAIPRVYSFQDVAEAMVVHELTDAGAEYADIREAISGLRERFGEDWPLTGAKDKLKTYGKKGHPKRRIAYKDDDGRVYDLGRKKWQQMDARDLGRISGLLRRGGWAARNLPKLKYIEVDPDRLSGTPTIKGRRVAAKGVAELADSGSVGVQVLREEYDLSNGEIRDAQKWWTEARRLVAA
jgi:uncharacterized protein (DUF433 family)/DNA-binding transcriptional MerR regulator